MLRILPQLWGQRTLEGPPEEFLHWEVKGSEVLGGTWSLEAKWDKTPPGVEENGQVSTAKPLGES